MLKMNSVSSMIVIILTSCIIKIVCSQLEDMASPNESTNVFSHISKSTNKFSDTIYSNIAAKIDDNVACSPFSTYITLSSIAYGAEGKTAAELKKGLYFPTEESLATNGFKTLLNSMNEITGVELNLANALFIQENVSLVPDFLSLNSEIFHSDTLRVDFEKNDECIGEINSWIEKQTNNKIKDVISSDDINDATKIILVNAIYFKGVWSHKFDTELTKNKVFHISRDVKTYVPTMSNKFRYAHGQVKELNARIIDLPYSNKDFSMLILLPNDIDGLQFVETNFHRKSIENVYWETTEIELTLPKFKVESTIHLKEILEEMNMRTMFSNLADFSGIALGPLKVENIINKAFIEINEEGSEAAVASVVNMRQRRMAVEPQSFQVDRPFMFVIDHKPSNIPIFVGSIRNLQTQYEKDEL